MLTAILSLFLVSCAKDFPKDPEIKEYFLVIIDNDMKPYCVNYDLISYSPFKIKNPKYLDITACNMVGGFSPSDTQKIINYTNDVKKWAEKQKSKGR
jgi:hypothetical protein